MTYKVTKIIIVPNITLGYLFGGDKKPDSKIIRVHIEDENGKKAKTEFVLKDNAIYERHAPDFRDPMNPDLICGLGNDANLMKQVVDKIKAKEYETLGL